MECQAFMLSRAARQGWIELIDCGPPPRHIEIPRHVPADAESNRATNFCEIVEHHVTAITVTADAALAEACGVMRPEHPQKRTKFAAEIGAWRSEGLVDGGLTFNHGKSVTQIVDLSMKPAHKWYPAAQPFDQAVSHRSDPLEVIEPYVATFLASGAVG
jgi:hypothetical protein